MYNHIGEMLMTLLGSIFRATPSVVLFLRKM